MCGTGSVSTRRISTRRIRRILILTLTLSPIPDPNPTISLALGLRIKNRRVKIRRVELTVALWPIVIYTSCLKKTCANLSFAPCLSNMNRFQ